MQNANLRTAKIAPLSPNIQRDLDESSNELDVIRLGITLWRGRWIVLLAALAAVAASLLYIIYVATPIYTSSTVVSLQSRNEQIVDFENVLSGLAGDQASINTEVEVLKSRGLIEKLVVELGLEQDPEFNIYLEDEPFWSPAAILRTITGAAAEPPPTAQRVRDKTMEQLLEALSISNVRQSYVFQITVRTTDPDKSALIANSLANLYIQDQIGVKFEATEQATIWLTERVDQLEVSLERAENAVKEFNTLTDLVSPEALEALNRQLKEFRDRLAGLSAAEAGMSKRVTELEAAGSTEDRARMVAVADDAALAQMLSRLDPDAEAQTAAFDNRYEQIVQRARIELERNRAQSRTLTESIGHLERQVQAQSVDLLRLEQLEREAEASRQIYLYFLTRLKETAVQQGIQQPDSRLLSRAVVPEFPSAPRKALVLVIFAVLGAMLGAAIVILRELRSQAFRTPQQMESETGVAVLGQIPRAPSSRRRKILDYIRTKPTSAMVEAVRNMRTSILLSSVDKQPKVIMLTSSVPGEGKTTLSLSLAQNLASMGKKVLIIEGDIRRRTFGEFFDLKDKLGLVSAVVEDLPLDEVIYHEDQLGVDILIGEKTQTNAADFFSSDRFARFLDNLRKSYDYIIVDTPPVLVVPDARVIGQLADVVIYVVLWDSTTRTQVKQGIGSFGVVNVPVTGLVLSQIDPKGMRSYGYGASYSQYGKGYYDG
ncbi:MAG: polysaccharide biosynthesis tyrosine autokinase [Pseudomonadota bacterium]